MCVCACLGFPGHTQFNCSLSGGRGSLCNVSNGYQYTMIWHETLTNVLVKRETPSELQRQQKHLIKRVYTINTILLGLAPLNEQSVKKKESTDENKTYLPPFLSHDSHVGNVSILTPCANSSAILGHVVYTWQFNPLLTGFHNFGFAV